MRAIAALLVLLAGCGVEPLPQIVPDAGAAPLDDAGPEVLADSGRGSSSDSGISSDSGSLSDSGISPEPDASTRVDAFVGADAGPPAVDAGAPTSPDAGPPPPPDAGPPGCRADAFEANDAPAAAALVASGVGWPHARYDMTWSEGDGADWIGAELDSTGVVGMFRVHAWEEVDARSSVEVRVTCLAGLVVCRGSGATRSGATCVGRRAGDAYVDVSCNTASPAAVDVQVGAERGAADCGHRLAVILEPTI